MTPKERADVVVGIVAQVYQDLSMPTLLIEGIVTAIDGALAEEREAWARQADHFADDEAERGSGEYGAGYIDAMTEIAKLIRERGKPSSPVSDGNP